MLFLLLLPALILVYYYYRQTIPEISGTRKVLLFALRTIAILILLILIFNPVLNIDRTIVGKPQIVFLNDYSYSMELTARSESKKELMESFSGKLTDKIEKSGYEVRSFSFAEGIDGSRTSTNLTKTLQDMTKKVNPQRVEKIFLLSDGWFGDQQLDAAGRLNIPIWTVHPEYESEEFDIGINSLFYNQTAYTEDENDFIVDVYAENYTGEAELSFFVDDRVAGKRSISFSEEIFHQISFTHVFDNAGLYAIRAEIEAKDEEEHNTGNNTYPGAVRVLDKRSGVYILSDLLNWDVTFLKNALLRDERKDVKVFNSRNGVVYTGRNEVQFRDIFPDHLQMLVLVNYGSFVITDEQKDLLERFVGNGGGLLFIGQPVSDLDEILGVRESGIKQTFRSTLFLTTESRRYQTFANIDAGAIPTIDYLYVEPLLQSTVLARFNNEEQSPAIFYSEYKQGRVLAFTFFNLWRWQLRGEDSVYNEFVSNISSWLSNPAETNFIALSDKNSYFLGEPVNIKLTAYDETLSIHHGLNPKIYLYDNEESLILEDFLTFDSRSYNITLEQLSSGDYHYEIIDESSGNQTDGSFIVSDIDAERRNRGFNFPLLAYLSRQTNGKILMEDDLSEINFEKAQPTSERLHYEIPLYRHWLIITLFLLAFCSELYLRKKWGLL